MFNMYLNKDGDRSAQARAEDFTGHDSYGYAHYAKQIKPYRRRKRSDSRSPSSVRHSSDSSRHRSKSRSLRSRRTNSLTYEEKSLDTLENQIDLAMEMRRSLRSSSRTRHRIPHMSNKSGRGMASGFESIAKLFNCLSLEDRLIKSKRPNNPESYTTIKNEGAGLRKAGSEEENKIRAIAARAVHEYVEASGRYVVIEQLEDLGSRISKQWFLVRDEQLKTERLLTIVPYLPPTNGQNHLVMNSSTRSAIKALFQLLQHPYIYPVLDVDFLKSVSDDEWSMLVMVFPFNNKGSLKDLIYKSLWQNNWNQKYCHRSEGLPVMQVQRLGRQILEGLLFLQDRGFPPFGHLHSGNIIIQNGVARITGFENCILGFTSRINSVLRPFLATDPDAVDTLCFGHVLFEMCAGYELGDARPTAKNFSDIMGYPQVVRILHFIFDHPSGTYPSIEKLALLDFFRNIDLREMRSSFVPAALQSKVSRDVAQLLETLCARNGYTRMRSRSMSACDLRSSSSFFDDSGSSPESSSKTRCATPTPCNQQSDNILYLSCGRRASDVSMYGSATVLCECHKPGLCQNCGELTFHSPLRPSTPVEVESIRAGLNGLHLENLKSDNNRRNLSLNWGRGDSVYQTPLQSPSEVYAFISAPVVLVTPPDNVEMEHVI